MFLKLCKQCGEMKPCYPEEKTSAMGNKAYGFYGSRCWPCHIQYQIDNRKLKSTRGENWIDPKYKEYGPDDA